MHKFNTFLHWHIYMTFKLYFWSLLKVRAAILTEDPGDDMGGAGKRTKQIYGFVQ